MYYIHDTWPQDINVTKGRSLLITCSPNPVRQMFCKHFTQHEYNRRIKI